MPIFLFLSGKFHCFIVCFFLCVFLLDLSYATGRGSPAERRANQCHSKCCRGWKRLRKTSPCNIPICNNCGSRGKCIGPAECCCSDGRLLNNCKESESDTQNTVSPFAHPKCLCKSKRRSAIWRHRNQTHFECLDRRDVFYVGQLPTLAISTYEDRIVRRSLTGKSIFGLDKVDRQSGLKKTFNRNSDFGSVFNKSSNMNLPKSKVTKNHGGDPKQSLKAVSTKRNNPGVDLKLVWKQNGKTPDTRGWNWNGDRIEEKNKDYTKKHSSPDMMNKFLNNIYFQRHNQKPYSVQSQTVQQSDKTDPGKDYHTDNLHRFHEMLLKDIHEGKYLKEFDDSAHHVGLDYDFTYPDGTTSVQDILAAPRDSPTTGKKTKAYSDSNSFSGYKNVAQEIQSSTENYAGTNSLNERKTLLETGLNKESSMRQISDSIKPGGHKKIAPGSQSDKGNNERKQSANYKDTGLTEYLKLFSPDKGDPREWDESLFLKKKFLLQLDEKNDAGSVPSYFKQNKHWHKLTSTSQPQQKVEKLVPEIDTKQLQQKMEKIAPEMKKNQPQQKAEKTAHDKRKIQSEFTADENVANSEFYQKKLKPRIFKDDFLKKNDRMFEKTKKEDTESKQKGSYPSKPVYLEEHKDEDSTGPKKPLFLHEQLVKNVTPHTETQNKNYSKTTQLSKSQKDRTKIKQLSTTRKDYNDKKVLREDKIPGNKKQSKSNLTKQNKKVKTLINESSVIQKHHHDNNKDKKTIIKTTKQRENEKGMNYFDKVNQRQESHENTWKKYSNADDKTMIKGKFGFPLSTEGVSEKPQKTKQSLADTLPRYELQKNLGNLQHLK